MMSLFSSFNPITYSNLSFNWTMIILPIIIMTPSYWTMMSKPIQFNNLMVNKISTQLKSSLTKINYPNLIMITSIMMMIMLYNIMSLLPNTFSITSHMVINLTMALTIWVALMKKKSNTPTKFMSSLTPSNTPMILIPFMVLIELISLLIQPMTLSIRLTANITAGHIMMVLISQMYQTYFMPTLIMNLMMMMLEMGVSMIQAYVFAMLIIMYNK